MSEPLPLDIVILDSDSVGASAVRAAFENVQAVRSARVVGDPSQAIDALRTGQANALVIDIFNLGPSRSPVDGTEIIQKVREAVPQVPVCLLGTRHNLTHLPQVPLEWAQRFRHYYKLTKDQPPIPLHEEVGMLATTMADYIFARRTLEQVSQVRQLIAAENTLRLDTDPKRKESIERALADAERVMASRARSKADEEYRIAPIKEEALQRLIEDTLAKASTTIRLTSFVNLRE